MRAPFTNLFVAAALVAASGSACAMSAPDRELPRCAVNGGEKWLAELGGSTGLCAMIDQAVSSRAPGLTYHVDVRILSPSRLVAELTTGDGQRLPELNQAISDSNLTKASMQRFADAIADELARGTSR